MFAVGPRDDLEIHFGKGFGLGRTKKFNTPPTQEAPQKKPHATKPPVEGNSPLVSMPLIEYRAIDTAGATGTMWAGKWRSPDTFLEHSRHQGRAASGPSIFSRAPRPRWPGWQQQDSLADNPCQASLYGRGSVHPSRGGRATVAPGGAVHRGLRIISDRPRRREQKLHSSQ